MRADTSTKTDTPPSPTKNGKYPPLPLSPLRSFILWNSIPTITNKQIQEENSRRQQLIRNMVLSNDGTSLPSNSL